MRFVFLVIIIILLPIAAFLFLPADGFFGKENVLGKEVPAPEAQTEKIKAEQEKEAERKAEQKVAFNLQPIRKEQVGDLVVPNAHSAIVLDVDSGTILHYQNGREKRQIASLTKLMTATLVLEKVANLDEAVTIDEDAVYIEGTKVGCPRSGYCISQRLKVGEKVKVRDLLKAMLMNSANDAATALGKHIGGTEEKFAEMMNEKAQEIGLKDSHFCTASGLEPDGRESECYSTAYDIARIAAYSMKYDLIWQTMRLPNNTVISSCDGKYQHQILNTDLVMDQIANCLGGKTGFTPLAGHSLLMAASDFTGKHRIVAVALDDPYRWQDIQTMIGWAWESYDWR